ncbi:LCI fold-containing protein [Xenorhabdus ehlersii]|uniref:Antimicrobial protein lci n=1 Tax=Xenorhabdus ehlersii TaxID=290111 RepID=A0A2D0IS80_9GAMM|nr:LCI fold-containing protein [Xenorhabdus ehlersii]PHM24642.1 hypothetical protein Xehl_01892 [Xenorhabdus ehlersii]RKE91279.1 antimicrobial protein lci [Xenorhabdus ehlersii]
MLKKLLAVGALSAVLLGGIGTASASGKSFGCSVVDQVPQKNGDIYTQYVIHKGNSFANAFTDKKTKITWYLKIGGKSCGNGYYYAFYEGRKY